MNLLGGTGMEKLLTQAQALKQEIIARRRDLHKHPESAWTEFRTASIVAQELTQLGFEVLVGDQVIVASEMMGVPDALTLQKCQERALKEGADPKWVDKMQGGKTGVMGVMKFSKPGKTVAIRVDMDANDVEESKDAQHQPNQEGFASVHANVMHACGHDGHTAMGLAIAKLIAENKDLYAGTIKLIFQPGEEGVRGAKAMVASGIVDDVDYLFGMHVGFNANRNDTIVCMTDGFLATTKLDARFKGLSSHAGSAPHEGKNALLAAAQASISMHSIARHGQGASRINVGVLQAGTGRNVLPDVAVVKLETRGANTEINEYMMVEAKRMIQAAAMMYDVEVEVEEMGGAPSCSLDREMGEEIQKILLASGYFAPEGVIKEVSLGASEDCSYFMQRVQEKGGKAVYMMAGSELKAGHHNSKFDFYEETLVRGAASLALLAEKYTNR